MKPVEPSTVGHIQPLHGLTEISFRRLDLQMVLATHQRIGMNLKSEPGRKNAEQVEKMPIRALVRKELPLLQAAVGDVIPAVFNVEPQWPGHGQENNPPGRQVQYEMFRRDPRRTENVGAVDRAKSALS
jgi:hypothetical protein